MRSRRTRLALAAPRAQPSLAARLTSSADSKQRKPDHPEADKAVAWLGALYAIDERLGDDLQRRAELRRTKSVVALEELKGWLREQAALTSLSIDKAAAYAISNWDRLIRFVEDARIPLDRPLYLT